VSAAIVVPTRWRTELAERTDLDELVAIEQRAWPHGCAMRATAYKLALRIELGCLLATRDVIDGRTVGFLSTFRPRWADIDAIERLVHDAPAWNDTVSARRRWAEARVRGHLPADWYAATDSGRLDGGAAHDPNGPVVFGIGVTTDPQVRGLGIAQRTLRAAMTRAGAAGARLFLAYGRLPLRARFGNVPLHEYIARRKDHEPDAPFDPGLRLHWRLGAQPLQHRGRASGFLGIPDAMRGDMSSLECGALVVTPLR
jgi:GNAT superfamily N-acetyltransferase